MRYCPKPDSIAEFPGLSGPYDHGFDAALAGQPHEVPDRYSFHLHNAAWSMGWMAGVTRKKELPPDPMTIDFKSDSLMAKMICYTHKFIDVSTGEKLVNPDGSDAIYYASESTGLVRYYKGTPSGTGYIRHLVLSSNGKPLTKRRRRFLEFFGIQEERQIASEEYYAPIRFVPIEGEEELALMVRGLYQQREQVNEQLDEMLDRRFPHSPK